MNCNKVLQTEINFEKHTVVIVLSPTNGTLLFQEFLVLRVYVNINMPVLEQKFVIIVLKKHIQLIT